MNKIVLGAVTVMAISQVACASNKSVETTQTASTTQSAATSQSTRGAKTAAVATSNSSAQTSTHQGGGFVEDKLKFKVSGMHCGGCADSIKSEVEKVPGVAEVTADYKTGEVVVISSGPSKLEREKVAKAIEGAGTFKIKK